MLVRLLGGLAVEMDDAPVPTPRGRCASLLALLALHPGMQPRARVAARLWPDVLDESARRSLRTALLDLRSTLGPEPSAHLIGTQDRIGLGPEVRTDVRAFTDAVTAGRLEEALAIGSRGELLPDLEHEWVLEHREAHELRLAEVIERLAVDAESRGDPGAAVEYTRRLMAMDPLSEEHARSLMRRLALAEDRAAALAVYDQHSERLRSELRMAPSLATRTLAGEIRAGEAETGHERRGAFPLPGALVLAARSGPLVGREGELAQLEAAWQAVSDGNPRLCLVTGEAGIGKSRLIAGLAERAAADRAPVLYGGCQESHRPPYGPFVDAISLDLRGLDLDDAGRRLGTSAGELSRIVPDLRDRFGAAGHVPGESPEGDQLRLFNAVGDYLERAAQPRVLVVLEDIHWAASGTLALLAHLVRTATGSILLVASSRDVPPDMTGALSTFLSDLARYPAVQRIELSGLSEPDVEDLLRATAPQPALDFARTARLLHQATGGSPLFLREVVRELPADGLLLAVPLSRTLRDHVAARFERLDEPDGAALDAAAVLGSEFDARDCAQVLDRPLPDVLDALDRASALGIVVALPAAAGRFAFTHAVLREVRYEAIPPGRRMRLHHAAGTVLRATGAPATDLARHFFAAADLGDREVAYAYARRAGELARERFAYADAAVHFEQARQLAAQLPDLGERELCELDIELGEALHRAGDPRHRAVLLEAAATSRRLDDSDLLTRAALALSEQGWTITSESQDEIVDVAGEAIERLPESAQASRARLMAMIAAAVHLRDHPRGSEFGTRALAAARASGDTNALGEVLISAHWACFDPLNLDWRLALAQEACELGERLHKPVVLAQALRALGQDHLELGDLAGARAAFTRADQIANELDTPFLRLFGPAAQAVLAALEGRIDDAERLVADCLALSQRIGVNVFSSFGAAGGAVLIERGLWEYAAAGLEEMFERSNPMTSHRAALTMFHARLGNAADAARQLEHFTSSDYTILPRNIQWAPGLVLLADAVTWLRDIEAAARIREILAPASGRTAWAAFTALWPIDIALAQLCVVLGDHAAAHDHLDAAERLCERNGLAAHRIRVALYRAWALRDAGEDVDASAAVAAADVSPCAGVAREARLMGLAAR